MKTKPVTGSKSTYWWASTVLRKRFACLNKSFRGDETPRQERRGELHEAKWLGALSFGWRFSSGRSNSECARSWRRSSRTVWRSDGVDGLRRNAWWEGREGRAVFCG